MNRWGRWVIVVFFLVVVVVTVQPFLGQLLSAAPSVPSEPPIPKSRKPTGQPQHSSAAGETPAQPQGPRDLTLPDEAGVVPADPLPSRKEALRAVPRPFTPRCESKPYDCLLDVWRDGPTRVAFAAHGRPMACTFRGRPKVTGGAAALTVPSSEHHSTGTFVVSSCVIPEHLAVETVEIAGVVVDVPAERLPPRRQDLSVVIMFRIFREDEFNVTFVELQEWLEAVLHAGAKHVYMYDNYVRESECQWENVAPYVAAGLVTYHPWPVKKPYGYPFSQQGAYTHCLYKYRDESKWQYQADVDEYPYIIGDTKPGYLVRFAEATQKKVPGVSQIHLQTVFFGKQKTPMQFPTKAVCDASCETRCSRPMLIESLRHREDPTRASLRIKPIFLTESMTTANVHMMTGSGTTYQVPFTDAWLLHYWGFRCKDCNRYDDVAQPLAAAVRERLRLRDCGR